MCLYMNFKHLSVDPITCREVHIDKDPKLKALNNGSIYLYSESWNNVLYVYI